MNILIFIAGMIVGFFAGIVKAFVHMEKEIQACSKIQNFKRNAEKDY